MREERGRRAGAERARRRARGTAAARRATAPAASSAAPRRGEPARSAAEAKPQAKPKPKGPSKNRLSAQQKAERGGRSGRSRAARAGSGAGGAGGLGDALRGRQVRGPPHGRQAGRRGRLRASCEALIEDGCRGPHRLRRGRLPDQSQGRPQRRDHRAIAAGGRTSSPAAGAPRAPSKRSSGCLRVRDRLPGRARCTANTGSRSTASATATAAMLYGAIALGVFAARGAGPDVADRLSASSPVRARRDRHLRADGGLRARRGYATERLPSGASYPRQEWPPPSRDPRGPAEPARAAPHAPRPARRLPVPGRRGARDLRRQGEVGPQAGRLALLQGAGPEQSRPCRDDRRGGARWSAWSSAPRPRRCWPSRASSSSTGRASTSACATTSPTRSSRSRSTRTSRACTSPASATAATACTSAPIRTPSACARRSRCWRRCSCSAPAPAPSPVGAAAIRASTTTSSAARRRAWATSRARNTARASTGSSTSSPGASATSSASSSSA